MASAEHSIALSMSFILALHGIKGKLKGMNVLMMLFL